MIRADENLQMRHYPEVWFRATRTTLSIEAVEVIEETPSYVRVRSCFGNSQMRRKNTAYDVHRKTRQQAEEQIAKWKRERKGLLAANVLSRNAEKIQNLLSELVLNESLTYNQRQTIVGLLEKLEE